MSDWFQSKKTKAITHYCGGLDYDQEGTNKMRGAHTKLSRWFRPVKTLENGVLKCSACLIEVQKDDIEIHLT